MVMDSTTMLFTEPTANVVTKSSSAIEHADALDWLARQAPDSAKVIVFDPPYSRYSRCEAGKTARPAHLRAVLLHAPDPGLCARVVQPKGIVICFGDWELLPDLQLHRSITGLREHAHLAWSAAAQEAAGCSGARATRS